MKEKITWGVDSYGNRHFICKKCGARLGYSRTIQAFTIKHTCGDGRWGTAEVDEAEDVKTREDLLEQFEVKKSQ